MKFKDEVKKYNMILGYLHNGRLSPYILGCTGTGHCCTTNGSCCGGYMGHKLIEIESNDYFIISCQEDVICNGNRYEMERKK
jgi:hypothetical protein